MANSLCDWGLSLTATWFGNDYIKSKSLSSVQHKSDSILSGYCEVLNYLKEQGQPAESRHGPTAVPAILLNSMVCTIPLCTCVWQCSSAAPLWQLPELSFPCGPGFLLDSRGKPAKDTTFTFPLVLTLSKMKFSIEEEEQKIKQPPG